MPYTFEQLEFLGTHIGVVIPPEFIENKRRAERFKQRSAEITSRVEEMKQRHDGPALEELFNRALTTGTDSKDFAAALELLDQVEVGLNAPDLPPPPIKPPPPPPKQPVGEESTLVLPDASSPEGAYRLEKTKLIGVINDAAKESAEIGGEDIRTWVEKMEVKELAKDWPAATELLHQTHRKAELLNQCKPYLVARQENIHKINAAKKIKVSIPQNDKSFGEHKTYGAAVSADWEAVLGLVKNNDFKNAATGIIALANKIDTKITPAVAKAREQNATQLKGLNAELEVATQKGDLAAMRSLAEKIFKNTAEAENLGVDPGENARKPFTPDAVWTADKCEATFVAYDWFALKKCRKARKITLASEELGFSDDDMWKLVQYRGKVVNEIIDLLRKEFPTLIAKASGSEDIESDIDITFATPGSGDDVKAAAKFNAAIKTRFKKPPGRVFDVNIYPRDYGAIKESFKADYNVEEIKDDSIDEPDQEESAKLSKIDQDVATLLKQRRFLDADKFNAMLQTLLDSAPDPATRKRIEKQYEEGEDIYLLTSLEKVEKIRAQVDLGEPAEGEDKHKQSLREKLAQFDQLKGKSDRESLARVQELVPEILDLFEEVMPAETMEVTDAQYLEKMGSLREDQGAIRSLKQATAPADTHHPKQTCEEVHPKQDHEAWRKQHLNALEVKVKKDMFTNIVFANEAIMSQGALKHVVVALQAKTPEEKAKALEILEASDLMQSVNEQVADLAKEMKHFEGLVEEAQETEGGDEAKELAKRRATGEGFVHASKYFFRLLDAAILLAEKYKDNSVVSAVVSKPYDALKTREKLTLEALKKRVDDVLLKLRKSAVIPPDVKGEVGALEIEEIFQHVTDIPTFRKMITDFAIELNLRIRSMDDFKQSQEMVTDQEKEAEKAYFKAAAPKPDQTKPEEIPPPPDQPLPPAPSRNPVDAIKAVTKTATAAQETIRAGTDQLMRLQDRFIDLQSKRKETAPGIEFDGLTAQMTQLVEDIKGVIASQNQARDQIVAQQKVLAGIAFDAPDAPRTAAGLHQKATAELAERARKGQTICAESSQMLENVTKALADGSFTAKAGVKVYASELFEIPSVLRDLIAKLETTTRQYRGAKQVLDPLLATATGLLETASAGKPLPGSTTNDLQQMETTANGQLKSFGGWNAAINSPWKSVRSQLVGADKAANREAFDLFWRGEKLYDEFSQAYGEADETGKNVIHLVAKLKLATNAAPASPDAANAELRALIEAITKLRTVATDPINRLSEAKRGIAATKKELAKVDDTGIETLEQALTDVNQDLEKVRANLSALRRVEQEAGLMAGLIKSRFTDRGIDKKLVASLKKLAESVEQAASPALSDGAKTEAALLALREEVAAKRATLGSAASVEDTVRLTGVLKELPKLPSKDELLPANGVKQWKGETAKGGDKKSLKLFADVTKAWEAAEKQADEKSLGALDSAAGKFLAHYHSLDPESQADATDTARAAKCREAAKLVRQLRLQHDLDAMPEPPWTDEQATKAKQLEACVLLETGTPAKPPSGKGESDSFFLKNGDGKPAFIFKPKEGENVKEGGKEGEGAVREVLSSKFNQQMATMIGVDFGVCPTDLARLESDSFAQGEKSQATSRVGALQQVSENEGNLITQVANDPTLVAKIKTEDVQKIAMLDFLTLQGDRNPDNILIKDVNGEKRLVPIDGGFAFPSTELFNTYSSGMAAEPKGGKTGQVQSGQNGLMQLPQSDEKFTPEMLEAIDAIDPAAVAKGLKQANAEIAETAPDLKGLVAEENIENVRRSAMFLKKAARQFTVAELAEVYALDFKRVLAASPKQVDKEIAAVIATGLARVEFKKQAKADETEYNKLGGDTEIEKLGWSPRNDRLLRLDWKRKIAILKKHEAAPPTEPEPAKPPRPDDEESLQREYKSLGGDKELQKFMERPDAGSPKATPESKINMKVGRLRLWKEFKDLGGDAAFKKIVDTFRANQYEPFDTLPKATKAAVAVFAGQSWDPDGFELGSKRDALRDYKKLSK